MLVQSPEKLEATLKELQIAVNKERALTTEAERRSRALQTKLDTISKVGLRMVCLTYYPGHHLQAGHHVQGGRFC